MSDTAHMTEPHFLTIEEAARILDVSIATARRMASSGQIKATKSGKQWLVDGASLRRRSRRRPTRAAPSFDFELALKHVRTTDLVQAWVPDVLRYEDALARPADLLAEAAARIATLSPGPALEVEVDKTLLLTRPAVLLSLPDRIAYQAVVGSFADRVEAETPPSVFSARLSDHPDTFLKPGAEQWVTWRQSVLDQLDDASRWLVESDLTAHFDTVNLEPLIAELRSLNVEQTVLDSLTAMLRTWQPVRGVGLPQGPNASRLLANLHLLPVDRAMLRGGWRYSRFMDDVRIVASTRAEAVDAIRAFQKECRARGLIVSAAKTRLLFGEEAKSSLRESDDLAFIQYLMDQGLTRFPRKKLQTTLRKALASALNLDDRRVRFSLWRLAKLRDGTVLGLVLRHLQDLGPHAQIVAGYLRPFISRPRVVRDVNLFLNDPDRSRSRYLVAWLLAAMLEHPGRMPSLWAEQARRRAFDRNEPTYVRALASIIVARGMEAADVARIKAELPHEHDPAMLRGYVVALHWAGQLDRAIQRQLVNRCPELHRTFLYLQGRPNMPSLVHHEADLRVI